MHNGFSHSVVIVVAVILAAITVPHATATYSVDVGFETTASDARGGLAKASLPFIENMGQADSNVKYYANTFAGTVFVTEDGLTYALSKGQVFSQPDMTPYSSSTIQGIAIKENLLSQHELRPIGLVPSDTVVNYFVGDTADWRSNILTYNSVGLGQLWPGIEVELKVHGDNVEKIFRIAPGADVGDIQVSLEGITGLSLNKQGELLIETELGAIAMTRPVAFQHLDGLIQPVEVSYHVADDAKYGFLVGGYDPRFTLVIDPLLASTFIGDSNSDEAYGIAIDSSGDVYVAGISNSANYPTTPGAYDTTNVGGPDVFVSKLDSDLTTLLASTFIGGSNTNEAFAIAIDSAGNVYVAGRTNSVDFPTTPGAYNQTHGGLMDVFVSKLSSNLATLSASTYLGGDDVDEAHAIAIDNNDDVFVAGWTSSAGYPTTVGAYDTVNNLVSGPSAFVSHLSSDLTALEASTFLGGDNDDEAHAIAIDSSGDVYVTGRTNAADFPTTGGAYDTTHHGNSDVFVSHLSSDLTALEASTFLGGANFDLAYALDLTSTDAVYVTGRTISPAFPTTSGAYDQIHNGDYDVFVSQLNSGLSALPASTFIGGPNVDYAQGIALDSSGANVYVTGLTSVGYPTTPGAHDESANGNNEAFVSLLNSGLSALPASTFIGGPNVDLAQAIAIDALGDVYIAGIGGPAYPTTSGAYDTSNNGVADVFVSKFTGDLLADATAFDVTISDEASCEDPPIGGTWDSGTDTCTVSSLIIGSEDSLTISSGITLDIEDVENSGTIDILGTLDKSAGSFTNDGSITNHVDGIFNNNIGSQLDNNIGGTITNAGTITNDGAMYNNIGSIDNSGIIDNSNVLDLSGGGSGGTLNNNEGSTITNTGTISINHAGLLNNDIGAEMDNSGIIYNYIGGFMTNGGTITNSGTINNANGEISNTGDIVNSGTITNGGTINNDNGGTINNDNGGTIDNSGDIANNNGGIINNLDGGTIDNSGDIINYNGGIILNNGDMLNSSTITNSGTIHNANGEISNTGDIANSDSMTNAGIINNNNGGTITNNNESTLDNNGDINNNDGGTITNNNGGSIDNNGDINNYDGGTITNAGFINNSETITNECGAVYSGNPPNGNPVNFIPCADTTAPDGRIAFASDRDGNFEIYVMNSDGTDQTRLTNNAADDFRPSFSPDGTRIAFDSDRDVNFEIYVMNSDGTDQTRLTNNAASDSRPSFSPDGTRIAFTSDRDGNAEIYVMNADGTGQTRLTNNAAFDHDPSFSPDGTKIAFASLRDGNFEIYVMDSDGGTNQINLSNNAALDSDPSFSLDGIKIAFRSDRDGNPEIYVMDSGGTGQTRLTNNAAYETYPSFSSDRTKIAFYSDRDGNFEIYVMDSDGTNQINLSNNAASDSGPNFEPFGLISPANDSSTTDDTPTFDWTDATDASNPVTYEILVDNNPSFASPEISESDITTSDFTSTLTLADGTYSWKVRAQDAVGNVGEYSSTFTFTVTTTHPTILTLNPIPDVTATTGFTVSGILTDAITEEPISGQLISFIGAGAPSLQSVTTEGVTFTGNMDMASCEVPASCDSDEVGIDTTDTSNNMVLHLDVGGKITFPAGTVTAKIYLQDMGDDKTFKYIVEEGNGVFQPVGNSAGPIAPGINVLQMISGSTSDVPNGLKEITFTEVDGSPTTGFVGIAAVLTGSLDGLPVEQHQINFEDFADGAQQSPLEVNAGYYFSTGASQNTAENELDVTARFLGSPGYAPSDSSSIVYNAIANTQGIGGEGSTGTGTEGGSITVPTCVSVFTDIDGDGICDGWEGAGGIAAFSTTYLLTTANLANIDNYGLPKSAASTTFIDIFVEFDCMSGFCPATEQEITDLKTAFNAEKGSNGKFFRLHVVRSDTALAVKNPLHVWTDTESPQDTANDFDNIKKNFFGTAADRTAAGGTLGSGAAKLKAKALVFHYGLFAKNINTGTNTACGPSGQAELDGSDFIVALGCGFTGTAGSPQERMGTFMHELGHNLGLHHGGQDDDNCKPNLISVMSYSRQVPWTYLNPTTVSGAPAEWVLTYSREALLVSASPTLNEASLTEGNGLRITASEWTGTLPGTSTSFRIIGGNPGASPSVVEHQTGASVNWNNAAGTGPYSLNINKLAGMTTCDTGTTISTLQSYDEWKLLTPAHLNFRDGGTVDGLTNRTQYQNPDTVTELTPAVLDSVESATAIGPDNISNNAGSSVTPDVAVADSDDDGNNEVYVVWSDTTGGTSGRSDIVFKKSTDGGSTFDSEQNISTNSGISLTPRIAVSGNNVYVIWSDTSGGASGKFDIMVRTSNDGGANWNPIKNISTNSGDSTRPEFAIDGSNVYAIWSDLTGGASGKFDIMYRKSIDGGLTWLGTGPTKLSNTAGESLTPSIGVSGNHVYVAWSDTTGGTSATSDIFVRKSANSGNTFDAAANISTNSGESRSPHLAVTPAGAYVVWSDPTGGTSGKFDILMKKTAALGGSFGGAVQNISSNTADSLTPRVAASDSGSTVYVTWSDKTGGTSKKFDILVIKSTDGGSLFGPVENISTDASESVTPALAIDDPSAYLAWGDGGTGQSSSGEIKYASRII